MSVKKIVIFDFDWSFVNENTDVYIFKQLCPKLITEIEAQRDVLDWTSLMDHIVGKMIKEEGVNIEDMSKCLRRVPYFQETFFSAKLASQCGSELYIISDANNYYIKEVLDEHGLEPLFSRVFTNFASVEDGVLRIRPYHQESSPHNCSLCPPNL